MAQCDRTFCVIYILTYDVIYLQLLIINRMVLGLFHGFAYYNPSNSGYVYIALVIAINVTSLPTFIRRKSFEFFFRTHAVLFIAIIVLIGIHTYDRVEMLGVAFYVFDVVVRLIVIRRNGRNFQYKCNIKSFVQNVTEVYFQSNDKFKYTGGQYVFMCVPEISIYEWHPISISPSLSQSQVRFHIR